MFRGELLRTASFRLALLYAALFSVSAVALILFVYHTTTVFMQRQFDSFIESQEGALLLLERRGGARAVADSVAALLRPAVDPYAYYLVLDADGRKLGGNLPEAAARLGWSTQGMDGRGETSPSLVRTKGTALPAGGLLVVGRSEQRLLTVQRLIRSSLHVDLGATLLLAGLGGIALSSLALRRVEAVEDALRRIMHGELSTRLVVAGRDEFARLTRRVNQLLDWSQASAASLQQATNDIAHDLRAPLSHLRESLDDAVRRPRMAEHDGKALGDAIARIDGVLAVSSALLRLAQIEAGARRARFRRLDLAALVGEMHEVYRPVARAEGRELDLLPHPGAWVQGDGELLGQLVANLVENAIRHTPPGTWIGLGTLAAPPTLVVTDTGHGIPPGERAAVFRRFHKLDRGRRQEAGSGLGLSMVAAIAALHGAEVTLADNPRTPGGAGLRVAVRFPAEGAIPEPAPRRPERARPS